MKNLNPNKIRKIIRDLNSAERKNEEIRDEDIELSDSQINRVIEQFEEDEEIELEEIIIQMSFYGGYSRAGFVCE